jgi:hypothetical protein
MDIDNLRKIYNLQNLYHPNLKDSRDYYYHRNTVQLLLEVYNYLDSSTFNNMYELLITGEEANRIIANEQLLRIKNENQI